MKNVLLLLALIIVGSIGWAQQPQTEHYLDPYNPEFVKGELIIKFKDNVMVNIPKSGANNKTGVFSVDEELKDKAVISVGKVFRNSSRLKARTLVKFPNGEEKQTPALYNIYRIKLDPGADIKALAESLAEDPTVEFAEPNYLVYTMSTTPNDPLYPNQWHLGAVNAPQAWDSTTGDSTQVIGILDTGVDWDHPDLDDNIWHNPGEIPNNNIDDDGNGYVDDVRGWDFINDDNDPNDDNAHGTHVAGIAAAEGNNGTGISGVAWNARIMPVKMLQSSGQGNSSDLAAAIEYASDNGATVINMSLGSYGESQTVKIALENAYATAVLVAAAGNDERCICSDCNLCASMFPAAYSFVIGVEASTPAGSRASFSNYDPTGPIIATNYYGYNYEVKAPGTGILSSLPSGNYGTLSGTSMAAPVVAGSIALVKSYKPTMSTEELYARLIQGANNGILDISNSILIQLQPDLYMVEHTIIDTLLGGDNDGAPDAGETIELFLTVKNAGAWVDSTWARIRLGQYEDTTVLRIIDSTSYIGDISTYASLSGILDPFRIEIDSSLAHNRQIVLEYEIGSGSFSQSTGQIILTVQHGIEIGGYYNNNLTLHSGRAYYATQSVVIDQSDTLFIEPGVKLFVDPDKGITVNGYCKSVGTADSMIEISGSNGTWHSFFINHGILRYTTVEGIHSTEYNNLSLYNLLAEDCIFRNNSYVVFRADFGSTFNRCNIINNQRYSYVLWYFTSFIGSDNNVINNISGSSESPLMISNGTFSCTDNNVLNNQPYNMIGYSGIAYLTNSNYYGSTKASSIQEAYWDYFDDPSKGIISLDTFSKQPSNLAHAIVHKVEIDNINTHRLDNPYNTPTGLGVIGSQTIQFKVYFNRAMDTNICPTLTFGVREPYTQNIVKDNSSWSSDSTIWTAYKTINLATGDGINRIRVTNAQDTDHFEIPVEDQRFEFVIQAASAASIDFLATPGIGKVDLEWPAPSTPDLLGYNMYRIHKINASTYSDTLLLNDELITDTSYTDFAVTPDSTYKYFYKVVGTDMDESDYSKPVTATPFSAANGDANGDMSVNVLDITTIVSYMLNQDPEPFLFDAADVNGDDNINVLDIIGVVQLISGSKSIPISKLIGWDQQDATIFMDSTTIRLLSSGNIAALQFELQGENLGKINLFSNVEGFEFAYAVSEGRMIGVLYSFNELVIPEGLADLLSIELNGAVVDWGSITAGDLEGDYVKVNPQGNVSALNDDFYVSARPNPFNYSTSITYKLPEEAEVTAEIFNLHGQKIHSILSSQQPGGEYTVEWQGKDVKGQTVPAGIYFIMVNAKANADQKVYSKCIKLIYSNQ